VQYTFDFSPVFEAWHGLANGAVHTVRLAAITMAIGLILSVILALGKIAGPRYVKWIINGYIEVIRNTPLLVQMFFFFFGLPAIGIRLRPDTAAIVALVVNAAAYMTEIIRAGIESINKGQVEAGLAIGLSPLQVFRYVMMVPAMKVVYPAVTSQFNVILLGTSIASSISAAELMHEAEFINSLTYRNFEVYTIVAIIYFAMSTGFIFLFDILYKKAFTYPDQR
jgi:polar amino acid transport system permease protein